LLDVLPEVEDEASEYEADRHDEPGVVVMGGMGGPPIPVPTETFDPEPHRKPRD